MATPTIDLEGIEEIPVPNIAEMQEVGGVEAQPPYKLNPYEEWLLRNPNREPMLPMGPAAPEDLLNIRQIAQVPGALIESGGEVATRIARDVMSSWGYTPPPGPLFEFAETPALSAIMPGVLGPHPLWSVLGGEPGVSKGAREAGYEMLTGFTEPGAMLMLGLPIANPALARPVAGYFATGALAGVPESAREMWTADPEQFGRAAFETGSGLAIGALAGAHALRTTPRTPVEFTRERIEDATQERFQPEGYQPEYTGTAQERAPAEAGGGNRPQPSPEVRGQAVAETPQVSLGKLTRDDLQALADLGYTSEDILRMGDVEASNIIERGLRKPEAKVLITTPAIPVTSPRVRSTKRPPNGATNISRFQTPDGTYYEYTMPVEEFVKSASAKVPEGVEVLDIYGGEQPFAGPRNVATITPDGRIVINGRNLRDWLSTIEPDNWSEAIDAMVFEESNHVKVQKALTKAEREQFWDSLTSLEQLAYSRIYTGEWSRMPKGMTPELMGYEAMNHFQMRLARMTPREVIEAARAERWTVQSLEMLAKAIYEARRGFGTGVATDAAKKQMALLDKVAGNIETAKAVAAGAPGALIKFSQEEVERMLAELPEAEPAQFQAAIKGDGLTGSAWRLGLSITDPAQLQRLRSAMIQNRTIAEEARAKGDLGKALNWALRGQYWREAYEAATGTESAGLALKDKPEVNPPFARENWRAEIEDLRAPGARIKKQPEPGQLEMFLPPVPKGEAFERGAELPRAPGAPTAYDFQRRANQYLTESTARLLSDPKAPPPSFREFQRDMQKAFAEAGGKFQPGHVVDLWVNHVYQRLLNADSQTLTALRSKLKLESKVGDRQIADPPPRDKPDFALEQELAGEARQAVRTEKKAQHAAQKYRLTVIRTIAESLNRPALKVRPSLKRELVSPAEELSKDPETAQPVFHELPPELREMESWLQKVLTEDSRASGELVSSTKRLTVLQHRQTGEVFMVSTYPDGRRGALLKNPRGEESIPLKEILKAYRPLFSVLLDQPVKDFAQRFDTLGEWEAKFGTDARRASRSIIGEPPRTEYEWRGLKAPAPGESAPPGELISAPGTIESIVAGKAPPITPREAAALIDHLMDTVGDIGPTIEKTDITDAIDWLKMDADAGNLTQRDMLTISGYAKVYSAIANKWEKLTPEQVWDQMIDELYEKVKRAETGDQFEAEVVRDYAPELPEPSLRFQAGQTEAPPSGARELTMRERLPPTVIRGQELPKGPGPEPRIPEPQPPAKLTAEEIKGLGEAPLPEIIRPDVARYAMTAHAAVPKEPYTLAYKRSAAEQARFRSEAQQAGGQETQIAPGALMKYAADSKRLWDRTFGGALSAYGEWMTQRIRRSGKAMSGIAADAFDIIIDREKQLYGQLTPVLDEARRIAGRFSSATSWLNGINRVTDYAATSRTPLAIEGKIPIPAFAQRVVDAAKAANLEIGRLYQAVVPGFTATGLFQRNLTNYGYDILRQGRGSVFDRWAEGIAVANRLPVTMVKLFFKEWKEILDDPMSDQTRIEKVNQDFIRRFPNVVTHVKAGGVWQEVTHANLFNYLETAARRATHARAFREVFPNTTGGNRAFSTLITALRKELDVPYQLDLDAMVRALQGHPSDVFHPSGVLRSTEPMGQALKMVNQTLGNFFSKLVLTGQMFVQPGELFMGSTPVFFGYRNALEGMAKVKSLYSQMENAGEVNRAILDYSWDPTSPVRSVFKIGGNTVSWAFREQLLNELQEAHAAATANVVADRIRSGTLDAWEQRMLPHTFRIMNFTEGQIAGLMAGDPIMLDMFKRRAASFLTSGNKAIAEGSRLGADRMLNSIFRFQAYPMMKSNQFVNVAGNATRAWADVAKGTGTMKEAVNASRLLGRFLFGNAAQGALTTAITTLFYEGLLGTSVKTNEAKDEPGSFLVESFLAALSGPMYLLYRGAKANGVPGIGEQIGRMFFPYQVVRELAEFFTGSGAYKELDWFDRTGKFVKMKIPGSRAISTGLAIAGLYDRNADLEAAIRGFHRWSRDRFGAGGTPAEDKEDEGKVFRMHAKKAVEAAKRNNWEEYGNNIAIALKERGKKGVQSSLRARRILKHPSGRDFNLEELNDLENRIGIKALQKLLYFDDQLEALAR